MIYFSASKGVSLVAEFDKVRGQFPEKVRLATENHHIFMVAELVRPANSAAQRLHELVTCQETVVIYFSACKGVSLAAEFDKVRGQFPEKVLLTTENHHVFMVTELVRPTSSAAQRLHELVTWLETVVIYFSASKGVSLVAEFDKVRGQFLKKCWWPQKITTYSWWSSSCGLPPQLRNDCTSSSHARRRA